MPRDGSGVYSLPVGYLAVTGSPILASQHNPPLEDIEDAITASLPRDGAAGMTGDLKMAAATKITWNSGDVTVTHAANALAFAGASGGYTFDATLGGVAGVFSGTLSGAGITSTGGTGIAAGGPLTATTGAFSSTLSVVGLFTAATVTLSGTLGGVAGVFSGSLSGAGITSTGGTGIAAGGPLTATTGVFSSTLGVTGTSTLGAVTATAISVTSLFGAVGSGIGFYGTTPIAKQTGVAVSAAGIHAALVNLGLIS